jgi:predicted dehydrogenase
MKAEMTGGRRLIQVGFTRRFDPGYLAMKDTLASDRLGQALFLHCIHRNAVGPDYLTSDLVIASSAGHEFDIARFLLEDEIVAATVASPRASRLAPNRQPQFILLETAGGVIVDIEVFVDCIYGYDVRAELVCERAPYRSTRRPRPCFVMPATTVSRLHPTGVTASGMRIASSCRAGSMRSTAGRTTEPTPGTATAP